MKHRGWILTASLLVFLNLGSLNLAAQEPGNSAASTQPAATPAAVQPVSTTPGMALSPPAAKVPVSIDQVVDQIIEREHALIQFLRNRTPLVETSMPLVAFSRLKFS